MLLFQILHLLFRCRKQILRICGIRIFMRKERFLMRQTLTALLLALTLALCLTGCTRKDNSSSGTADNGTTNNGTTNGTNEGTTNNGTMNGGTNSGDGSTGNGTDSSARSHYGTYARPGSNGADGSDSYDLLPGRSYEQMLRDGRVHDSDGFLTDGENSVTEW